MKTIPTLAVAAALVASSALAQQYPSHPITLLVPFAPGPTDTVARVIAQSMSKPLGQSIVIENKPSAGGILAPELVKNAKPDGYTILIHHIGMATTPVLYRQLRFNPLTAFDYLGLLGSTAARQGDTSEAHQVAARLASIEPPNSLFGQPPIWRATIAALLVAFLPEPSCDLPT